MSATRIVSFFLHPDPLADVIRMSYRLKALDTIAATSVQRSAK